MDDRALAGTSANLMALTGDVVAAYVSHNSVPENDIAQLIKCVHATLDQLATSTSNLSIENLKPAIAVKKSVTSDYIICLEDGKKLKMLKRYLRSRYHLTPDEYRRKWGLPVDYPMVAPDYAAHRSALAKKIGLGRLPKSGKRQRSR
jgi:predicted transcriptional regulator